jgi:hypothetical protein
MVKCALLAVLLATSGIAFAETPVGTEPFSVPAGTLLHCRANQTLTTKLNKQGDSFTINTSEPISINGQVAIPVGSSLFGRIMVMERPGRIKGVGQMLLTVQQITLPDGRTFPLAATLVTVYGAEHVKVVGAEGLVKGPNSHLPDAEEIGAGTVGGTLVGLMFAQPLAGAAVGATATVVDRMRRRGKDLTIPIGTQLNYQLTRELAITHSASRATAANQVQGVSD